MLAVPAAFAPYLLSKLVRPVVVYELDPNPALQTERIEDGGFEVWPTSTNLTWWSEQIADGTINQETTGVKFGASCVRFDKTQYTSTDGLRVGQSGRTFKPGKWYVLSVWVKSSAPITNGAICQLGNTTRSLYLRTDGAWQGTSAACILTNTTTTWARKVIAFQIPTTCELADAWFVHLRHYGTTFPTSVWGDGFSILGPYDRAPLWYSSQAVTWQGITYTPLAVSASAAKESLELTVPEMRVRFSNVSHTLRSYFTPIDTLTGSRLTARLLLRDAAAIVLDDSLVLFKGRVRRPRKIGAETFELEAVGYLDGGGQKYPRRRTAHTCGWRFANAGAYDGAGDCAYQSTTTITADSVAPYTSHQVAASSNLVPLRSILDLAGNDVVVGSCPDATHFTTTTPVQFKNGQTIRYSDCNRTPNDCAKRAQLYRFGGFRAVEAVARIAASRRRSLPLEV